jgi:hypothetical protein
MISKRNKFFQESCYSDERGRLIKLLLDEPDPGRYYLTDKDRIVNVFRVAPNEKASQEKWISVKLTKEFYGDLKRNPRDYRNEAAIYREIIEKLLEEGYELK